MFFVTYEGGEVRTEADLGDWDHVPQNKPIRALGLSLPLVPIVLTGYEQYYCGRLGVSPLGGVSTWLGYVLIGIKEGICVEITAKPDGIMPKHYSVEQLNIRPEALRKGILGDG